jgi:hypothetical protein
MGNSKSSACMPICGADKEGDVIQAKRHSKFKKKPIDAKKNLKQMLEEESYER